MENILYDRLEKMALAYPQETIEQIMRRLDLDTTNEKTVARVYGILEQQELIRRAKAVVDKMTPEQLREMLHTQAADWAKSEAQWAKDFREGKCERD